MPSRSATCFTIAMQPSKSVSSANAPAPHHRLHLRDEHRHAEVLEGPGVRVAALLDPEVLEPDLAAEALGPEQVRVALVHRDDVLAGDRGEHPFLLAPDARAVRPRGLVRAVLEAL